MAPSSSRPKKPARPADSSSANNGSKPSRDRVSKRACNACIRCQRQKIKCSGAQPCDACIKRKLSCEFDRREQKVLVTRGYIADLQQKITRLEHGDDGIERTISPFEIDQDASEAGDSVYIDTDTTVIGKRSQSRSDVSQPRQTRRAEARPRLDPLASSLTNPLSSGHYMIGGDGRTYYLGTSSNWSFCRRVLNLTHEHVHKAPVPTYSLIFDGWAYDLAWDGSRISVSMENPLLPSLDHAIYLVNTVTFHCGQLFHLFDEDAFMENLYEFYEAPAARMARPDLPYIHILLILAFGKSFVEKGNPAKRPPGADLFERALQLLPDVHILCMEPIISTEIFCCIALYLQCLDFRHPAHNFIGQAVRMALGFGMNTDMPVQILGEHVVERCRRIWWTAYVLDREMTSLMGLPQSIHEDDEICPKRPTFGGSNHRTLVLNMQIRLCQIIATTNREVYGLDGRLNRNFLHSTKKVLGVIAGLSDELREKFPLQLDQAVNGISRTAGYLNLLYHRCIILATRPLLFCFLKIRFESPESYAEALNSSQTVWNLLKMCIDTTQQVINILNCLKSQGLLETFLPFDMESLFVSTVNLMVAPVLDPQLVENDALWIQKAFAIYDEIVMSGNLLAKYRKAELQQLDSLLRSLPGRGGQALAPASAFAGPVDGEIADALPALPVAEGDALPSFVPGVIQDFSFDAGPTTAQIMDMANAIQSTDEDWLSHTIMEHGIW